MTPGGKKKEETHSLSLSGGNWALLCIVGGVDS